MHNGHQFKLALKCDTMIGVEATVKALLKRVNSLLLGTEGMAAPREKDLTMSHAWNSECKIQMYTKLG
jgi:hypothetical protein